MEKERVKEFLFFCTFFFFCINPRHQARLCIQKLYLNHMEKKVL